MDKAMKERPILFSSKMVRAILAGRKTQTRRVIKPQPKVIHALHPDASLTTERIFRCGDQRIHCPYGKHGDRLWVRECFRIADGGSLYYRADEDWNSLPDWKPSIHMPRWASRITLRIADIRVERVQDISQSDAMAEGYDFSSSGPVSAREWYKKLWDTINAKRGFGWDENPWVWVIEFRRING